MAIVPCLNYSSTTLNITYKLEDFLLDNFDDTTTEMGIHVAYFTSILSRNRRASKRSDNFEIWWKIHKFSFGSFTAVIKL